MARASGLTGLLLLDKPSGPTSHDVVARLRRVLGERRIGHTGTLDPMASGLLPLLVGPATRLASVLTGHDKTYDATIRFGFGTTTDDALGEAVGGRTETSPADEVVRSALEGFRGTFAQTPPSHSAKKIGGVKAYELARRDEPVAIAPVDVTVRSLDWIERTDDGLRVRVTATAGFYVRALARDLGATMGCGGHLTSLRRLRSGVFDVADAVSLDEAERAGAAVVAARLIPPADALPGLPAVTLNEAGMQRAAHGNWLGPAHVEPDMKNQASANLGKTRLLVCLLAPDGHLVGLAKADNAAWHPVVVLG